MFSGRFSIDRVLGTHIGRWGSVELWAALVATAIACILFKQGNITRSFWDVRIRIYVGALVVLYLILTINIILFTEQSSWLRGLLDHVIFALNIWLILVLLSTADSLQKMAQIAVIITCMVGILWHIGVLTADGRLMGILLTSKLTIYRLEFFGFSSALFLAFIKPKKVRNCYLISAIFLLYTISITLAIAAVIAAIMAILWMLFWQLTFKQYQKALCVVVISLITITMFVFTKAEYYTSQVNARVNAAGTVLHNKWINGRDERIIMIANRLQGVTHLSFSELNEEEQSIIRTYAHLHNIEIPQKEQFRTFLWGLSHELIIFDGSERINFALVALQDWSRHKLFGQGLGNYSVSNMIRWTYDYETVHYPHNIFLEMLAGAGLVGFGTFCLVLFMAFILVQQTGVNFSPNCVFFGALMFYLVSACFAGDYYDFRLCWFTALFAMCAYRGTFPEGQLER